MSLVTCPACGERIGAHMKRCLYCGRAKPSRWPLYVIGAPVVAIGALFVIGSLSGPSTPQSYMREQITDCRRAQRNERNPMEAYAIGQNCSVLEDVFMRQYGVRP